MPTATRGQYWAGLGVFGVDALELGEMLSLDRRAVLRSTAVAHGMVALLVL